MTDSISAIGHSAAAPQAIRAAVIPSSPGSVAPAGADALVVRVQAAIAEARALGAEAGRAAELVRGAASTDVEGVLLATRKADAAFRMLDAVRNAMAEAYRQANDVRA